MVAHLLRHVAEETSIANNGQLPADIVGQQDGLAEDIAHAQAFGGRSGRQGLGACWYFAVPTTLTAGCGLDRGAATPIMPAYRKNSQMCEGGGGVGWCVEDVLMGVGADPISLMEDGRTSSLRRSWVFCDAGEFQIRTASYIESVACLSKLRLHFLRHRFAEFMAQTLERGPCSRTRSQIRRF